VAENAGIGEGASSNPATYVESTGHAKLAGELDTAGHAKRPAMSLSFCHGEEVVASKGVEGSIRGEALTASPS